MALRWDMANLPKTTLRGKCLPLPAADKANISTAGVGLHAQLPSPWGDLVWHMFSAYCCWPLVSSAHSPAGSKRCCFLIVIPCLWLSRSSSTLFRHESETWEEGCGIHAPFMARHSTVSLFLHLGHLWVSVLINIYCKQKFPRWGMRDALIYDYNDKPLGISLIFGSFRKIVDVFSLMIYDLSSNSSEFSP